MANWWKTHQKWNRQKNVKLKTSEEYKIIGKPCQDRIPFSK